jgi:hypothetical protein
MKIIVNAFRPSITFGFQKLSDDVSLCLMNHLWECKERDSEFKVVISAKLVERYPGYVEGL